MLNRLFQHNKGEPLSPPFILHSSFFILNYLSLSADLTSSSSFLMKRFARNKHTASITIKIIKGTVLNVKTKSSILAPKNFLNTMSGQTHKISINVIRKTIIVSETTCICFTRFLNINKANPDKQDVKNKQNAK